MKIAVYSDNFYPELSGISDSLVEVAGALDRLGEVVDFYVPRYSRENFATSHLPYQEVVMGENVRVHRLFSLSYPTPTKQGRLVIPFWGMRMLPLFRNKPDIVHTHLFFGAGMEALLMAFFLRRPLVGTSHTPLSEFLHYGPLHGPLFEHLALRLVSWYYNRCDFVTAPSQGIIDEMRRHGFVRPAKVISNPIDLAHFFPAVPEEYTALKKSFNLGSFTLLYTGRLAPEKHIDDIIRAMAILKERIPEMDLVITGHGESDQELKDLARELGLASRVHFLGTVSSEDHARIYRAADVFCIMSTAETQSLSMMKAMATGIPVIGARARGLAEYIKDDHNGFLVEPHDVEILSEKILYLYEHREERKRLGQGGLTTVKQFESSVIAREWQKLYREVLAQKSGQ